MGQKRIHTLATVLLLFCQKIASQANVKTISAIEENTNVQIECVPSSRASVIIWFRVLDNATMEFIASFSKTGVMKEPSSSFKSIFSDAKISEHILQLKSFRNTRDSGTYCCASLIGSQLQFGDVTRLVGQVTSKPITKAPMTITKHLPNKSTTKACVCNPKTKEVMKHLYMLCQPIIYGPLAGSCGLLLLLLIVTIIYCNRIRTRRCPHHYKRKPRIMTPAKQPLAHSRV